MKVLEFLQDENGKFSNNRLVTTLFGLGAIGISIFTVIADKLTSDVNILIGILVSAAVGNSIKNSLTNKNGTTTTIETTKT